MTSEMKDIGFELAKIEAYTELMIKKGSKRKYWNGLIDALGKAEHMKAMSICYPH